MGELNWNDMNTLEIKNISKSFGGVRALNRCTFALKEKKITALIGPNGAGKTTLFNVVNGFIPADEGTVRLHGYDVTEMDVWERSRAGMSRTFQSGRVFKNLSVKENLILSLQSDDDLFWRSFFSSGNEKRAELEAKIIEAARFTGFKKDLDTPAAELSYGEQKLFDLTRAVLNPHTLLLLDEPVAGVNPVIRGQLRDVLQHLKQKGETVLLIEHDIDFVRSVADWVIVMDQGSVLKEDAPEHIVRDKRVLEIYLGSMQ